MLINVTYGEPSTRVPLLQRLHFAVSFYMLSKEAGSGPAAAVPAGDSTGGIQVQGPMDALSQVRRASRGHGRTAVAAAAAGGGGRWGCAGLASCGRRLILGLSVQ